jgi:hypothetical protein
MGPGRPERQSHDDYRHGIVSLFTAYDVATGRVIGKCHNRHREKEFLKFMNLVDRQLPGETQIHIVLDNLAPHKTPQAFDQIDNLLEIPRKYNKANLKFGAFRVLTHNVTEFLH